MTSIVTQGPSHNHLAAVRNLRERTHLSDAQAPYHGLSHPDQVWSRAELLCDRCERAGISVNRNNLRDAVELHDALSHINPHLLGFSSSEKLAATLAHNFLISAGYSEETAAEVADIVMATNPDVRPTTPEQIIIRAADIWNIGSTYDEFSHASQALFAETKLARGQEIAFEDWIKGSHAFLRRFVWPLLELTPAARDAEGRSVWHTQAMSNLSRQWTSTFGPESPVVAEFFPTGEVTPHFSKPFTFYIGIHPDEQSRHAALQSVGAAATTTHSAAYLIPGTTNGFSLADESCDTVISHDCRLDAVCESLRVTKTGGTVVVPFRDTLEPDIVGIAQTMYSDVIDQRKEGKGCSLVIVKHPMI
jgi:hypothetical protein